MFNRGNLLLFLSFFILFRVSSQNLVPNASFEDTTFLPCHFIASEEEFNTSMQHWTLPTAGTSDIYSMLAPASCISNCFSSHPVSRGRQQPHTGYNMCGFYTYGLGGIFTYREYIQVQLTSPLIAGKSYYAEMYVSAAEVPKYFSNNIGMYFSTDALNFSSITSPLYFTPQIITNDIVEDTAGWFKISGTFTASVNARYLIIGNFNDDFNTSVKINALDSETWGAYYFIDDVSVMQICSEQDTTLFICRGNQITLASNKHTISHWALADTPDIHISDVPTIMVAPQTTTAYIATYDCRETSIFEVVVDQLPAFILGKDTSICQGQTVSFDVTAEQAIYEWQDGSNSPFYSTGNPGYYSVSISNNCGVFQDAILISVHSPSTFSFDKDLTICGDEIIQFNTAITGGTYLWQDGSTDPLYVIRDTGYYSVKIKNACGTWNHAIRLNRCCKNPLIPNLMTPNGDGLNDVFDIDCYGNGDYELIIYNRWGNLVYHNTHYTNNWNAEDVSDGIYYFVIKHQSKSIYNSWVEVLKNTGIK